MASDQEVYPDLSQSDIQTYTDFLRSSLQLFLNTIMTGEDLCLKQAALGHALMQAARPRAILAPLQIGLSVEMHHRFSSRFAIDVLHKLGFSSSYPEVLKFNNKADSPTMRP